MIKNILSLFLVFICALPTATAQKAPEKFQKVKELSGIQEYLYTPNGLKILLLQDNSSPVVTVQVVYGVGSVNEVSGTTGATHLLEHLMFKGTPKYNKRKGTAIFNVLQNVGAQMNATTWYDRTNYYETIPSSEIELALDIESDRMRNSLLLPEDKEAEMTVVRNEFEGGMNNPYALLDSQIWSTAFQANPYHHSTIGWRSDIENVPNEKLKEFYDTYYWPNNATLTLVGDFRQPEVFILIDQYFGKIPKSPREIPEPYTTEPEQYGPRQITVKRPGETGVITKAYKIPGKLHEDAAALEVLAQLMSAGPSSILYRKFVDSGIALDASAEASAFKNAGLFMVSLSLPVETEVQGVDQRLESVLDSIKTIQFKEEDIQRIVSKVSAQTVLYRDGSDVISSILTEAIASGDWTSYITGTEKLEKVTSADIQRVAQKYLLEDQSTTGYFIPESQGTGLQAENGSHGYMAQANGGKQFFRDPQSDLSGKATLVQTEVQGKELLSKTATDSEILRKTVADIDVISLKTSAKDFVTVSGDLSLGDYQDSEGNKMVPALTAAMLSKGTLQKDKIEFSRQLEELGVRINIYATDAFLNFSFRCLKKDVPTVIALFAEELKTPLFDQKEFENLKNQYKGSISQGVLDPGTQAGIALLKRLYKPGHPNYPLSVEEQLQQLEEADLEQVKKFHKEYFGTRSMKLVFVGDVEEEMVYSSLNASFSNWNGGVEAAAIAKEPMELVDITTFETERILIPEKTSATLLIGQATGLSHDDKDYLPLYLANSALGSGFSGRLMMTVRDEEGLTYGIGSGHAGDFFTDGYWMVQGTFSPELIEKGMSSSMREIRKWHKEGITQQELENIKSYRIGSYKVGLATTQGLASSILRFVNQGKSPEYIYQYPADLEKPGLKEVNEAIKNYLDPYKMVVIKAGTLNKDAGKELE